MTYKAFLALARANGWTPAQLRCDERPTPELLEAMDEAGPDVWERHVLRMEGTTPAKVARAAAAHVRALRDRVNAK